MMRKCSGKAGKLWSLECCKEQILTLKCRAKWPNWEALCYIHATQRGTILVRSILALTQTHTQTKLTRLDQHEFQQCEWGMRGRGSGGQGECRCAHVLALPSTPITPSPQISIKEHLQSNHMSPSNTYRLELYHLTSVKIKKMQLMTIKWRKLNLNFSWKAKFCKTTVDDFMIGRLLLFYFPWHTLYLCNSFIWSWCYGRVSELQGLATNSPLIFLRILTETKHISFSKSRNDYQL